jgi:hypothetical protein
VGVRRAIGRLAATAGLALLLTGTAAPAFAEAPIDLGGAELRDDAGVLDVGAERDVQSAIDALYERSGVLLRVVYVATFDDPSDAPAWADDTALLSRLGEKDVLLAIATEDRNYAYSVDPDFPLSNARLDDVAASRLIPELRGDDWAGGAVEFADGIGDALEPGPPWLAIIGGSAVIIVGVVVLARWGRRRHLRNKAEREEREALEALATNADALLVELDDSVATARQELGFAAAQFGDEATTEFREALERASGLLAEAFTARHALDVAGHAHEDRRAALQKITALCEEADGVLDAQAAAIDELRALEREAPRLRDELTARQATLAASIASAKSIEGEIATRYGEAALAPIDGSVAQAERLAAFTTIELQRAGDALAHGSPGAAAVRIRSAQQAAGQIDLLVASVSELAASLATAASQLDAVLADTRGDIAEARATALDDPRDAAELAAAADAAAQAIENAQPSPIAALEAVGAANAALAEVTGRVVDRAIERDRAIARLEESTTTARNAIRSAAEYIETRRGAVGVRPRSQLTAAEKSFASSRASAAADDPIAALLAARQAATGAANALRDARADVARDDPLPPSYQEAYGGYDGAATGGILGWLFGDSGDGGSSRSGWSSSSRSSWSGSSRRSSSSSSRRSSSSSSRRSGGSRSSSSRPCGGGRF